VWVFVVLIIRHAKRMRSNLLSSVACRTVLYINQIIIKTTRCCQKDFGHKMWFRFSLLRSSEMFIYLRRNRKNIFINMPSLIKICQSFLWYFKETEFSANVFGRSSKIKFNENFSYWSRVVPCGQRYMTKLIFAFRIFEHAHEKVASQSYTVQRPVRYTPKRVALFSVRM
jgi:hypothetical protein